jgi:hypothetical protein
MRAVPEGSHDHLLEFLKLYRDAVQMVVNELWNLDGEALQEEAARGVLQHKGARALEHTTLRGYMSTLRA